ncbi:MAG: TlpA family protein disulfide reductase [Chthonomonadales bacterium]|nr:TlpA family protein disulfide reductase [Chthonomonadales bacterium]
MKAVPLGAGIAAAAAMGVAGLPAARAAGPSNPPGAAGATLRLDTKALDIDALRRMGLKYIPTPVVFGPDKPSSVRKEPSYRGTPRYATLHVGNGPRSEYILVLDEPDASDSRLFADLNRNGDLTDDGTGEWKSKTEKDGRVSYGDTTLLFRASWGTPRKETSSGPYTIAFYHSGGSDRVFMRRETARVGTITFAGAPQDVILMENDADAVFDKPLGDDGKPANGGPATRPVWLMIGGQLVDIRGPFVLGRNNYEAKVTADGSRITLAPTTRALISPPPPPAPTLLAVGRPAPDFAADTPDGGKVRLADLRGKVVILDFWATWCGPCQASMPHIERVHQEVKGQDVAVLAVCVADERPAFDRWVTENQSRYTFRLAYDPAGRDPAKSISRNLFGVSGIPTTFVIDREGKVAAAIVGFSGPTDDRVEQALRALGVKAGAVQASASR